MNKQNSPESVVGQKYAKAKREWHNMSKTHLASYAVGFQTPALVQPLTGNTTVVLDMDHAIQTNPTVTPVFDSMRVNVRAFFAPARLYCRGLIGNNFVDLDYIEDIELPTMAYSMSQTTTVNNMYAGKLHAILPGTLLDRLGYPVSMLGAKGWYPLYPERCGSAVPLNAEAENSMTQMSGISWNVMPILAYYDICARYLSNPYDLEVPFPHFLGSDLTGTVDFEYNQYVNLHDVQAWIANCRGYSVGVANGSSSTVKKLASYLTALGPTSSSINANTVFSGLSAFGGIVPLTHQFTYDTDYTKRFNPSITHKTYQHGLWPSRYMNDYTTAYFDNEDVDALMSTGLVDGGDVTVESYRLGMSAWKRKLRSMLNGKKFDDWVEIHFGYNLKTSDHPVMVGADHFQIRFNDVFSNSDTGAGTDDFKPLGASASRGDKGTGARKQISFTTQEPGYLFVIIDIVPHVTYTGFNPNWLDWKTFSDFPLPEYAGRAFQDLCVGDVVSTGVPAEDQTVIGQHPLYYDFMTNRDTCGGIFSTPLLDTYTFKRKFDMATLGSQSVLEGVRSTYMEKLMYDYAFPDWGQNGGENIFIKSQFGLRLLQPIPRDVIKNHV